MAARSPSRRPAQPHVGKPAKNVLTCTDDTQARRSSAVVLDPRQFSLLNGGDKDIRDAIRAVMGLGHNKVPVQWASSAVFAVVNTQGRAAARGAAATYLAWDRVAVMDAVRADDELAEKARGERAEARRNLDSAVRRAYRHFLYLGEGDQDGEARVDRAVAFEPNSNQTSLDGTAVWKALVAQGKAFDVSALTTKALLHNLDEKDYGRPLDEFRDLFWSSPRLPLLPAGESDLQRAIFEAVSGGQLRLVGADDLDRTATRPGDIAVGSSGLRLAPPKPAGGEAPATGVTGGSAVGTADTGGTKPAGSASGTTGGAAGDSTGTRQQPEPNEREIAFSLMTSMSEPGTRDAVRTLLLTLSNAADDGNISWAQIQVKVIVAGEAAAKIEQDIRDTGANPSSRSV